MIAKYALIGGGGMSRSGLLRKFLISLVAATLAAVSGILINKWTDLGGWPLGIGIAVVTVLSAIWMSRSDNVEPSSTPGVSSAVKPRIRVQGDRNQVTVVTQLFGGRATRTAAPDLLPTSTKHYTNHESVRREADAALTEQLERVPLPVFLIDGPPGIGKSQFALYWANQIKSKFPDGVFYVDLTGAAERAGLVEKALRRFLRALGVPEAELPESLEDLVVWFRALTADRRVLVVADGAVDAEQVHLLFPGQGKAVAIVTANRSLSDLSVEHAVTPLHLRRLVKSAAWQLLTRLVGDSRLTAEPGAVDELIAFCDGVPIALCVMASMLNKFPHRPVSWLLAELRDEHRRLPTLSPRRGLSVEEVLNAACHLLTELEQTCYTAFSAEIGTGEFGFDTLTAMLGQPEYEVRKAVDELVAAWLIEEIGPNRYLMRDLVRLHARQSLAPSDGDEMSARGLARYVQRTVVAGVRFAPGRGWLPILFPHIEPDLHDPVARQPARWFIDERVNLRSAVKYADQHGHSEEVLILCVMSWPFYEQNKHLDDLFVTHHIGLRHATGPDLIAVRSLLLTQLAYAHLHRGEHNTAHERAVEAHRLAREVGHLRLAATATETLGLVLLAMEAPEARATLRANLRLAKDIGRARRIALACLHLAKIEEPEAALTLLTHALAYFVEHLEQDRHNEGKTLTWLGITRTALSQFDEAENALGAAESIMTKLRRPFDRAFVVEARGDLAVARGDRDEAERRYREALAIHVAWSFTAPARRTRAKLERLAGGKTS
ncbi:NB-ARC domain-containing protein [Crossiella sp. SN42]|uniref:NB-ARC domain-containing protein n=1 Tax=Crossiella sp. SN42 TaxID=2944808 RepID=UPI00273A6697|nr:NB-ARC domain-containing protein [Crossiella sp. SN42]